MTARDAGVPDRLAWASAVVAGGGAYVAGYLLTASLFLLGPAQTSETLSPVGRLAQIGMVFSNAHGVDVVASQLTPVGRRFNFLALSTGDAAVPVIVYLLIPVVVLFLTGFLITRAIGSVVPVVGVAAGYGGMAYLGSLVFRYTEPGGTVSFTVDGTGALVTGLGIPLAFAVPGAVVALAQAGASITS